VVQPPISSEHQHEERDPDPCPPEDEECFEAPDAASMKEAISKFVEGLEAQERSGFDDIHRLLKGLPVPVTKAVYVPSVYWYIRSICGYILEIYLYIPIIDKSLSEPWSPASAE
jgi:hypothetical protein